MAPIEGGDKPIRRLDTAVVGDNGDKGANKEDVKPVEATPEVTKTSEGSQEGTKTSTPENGGGHA